MKLGRYNQSPQQSTFLRSSNQLTPRNSYHSASKNPQYSTQLQKLPNISSIPTMRRSSSLFTSQRNTRNQLSIIQTKLQDLQSQVHNARMDVNQTYNHIKYVKQQLIDNKLTRDNQELKNQLNGLRKLLNITKTSHESRSNQLRQNYIRLWNQTEDLRQMVFDIQMKMDKIQDIMGLKCI